MPVAAAYAVAASSTWPETRTDCSGVSIRRSSSASIPSMRSSAYASSAGSARSSSMYAAASMSLERLKPPSPNLSKQYGSETVRFASIRGRQNSSVIRTRAERTGRSG